MQAAWEMLPHPVGSRRTEREIANRREGSEIKFHGTLKKKKPRNLPICAKTDRCISWILSDSDLLSF